MTINSVSEMTDEVRNVCRYLEENHFHASHIWIDQCVEWLKQDGDSNNQNTLNKNVFEQWLLADLRDMEIGSLPQDISSFRECKLPGKYGLQVEYVKDSSQSSYSQIQKIRHNNIRQIETESDNKYPKVCPNRVLSLYMCDGIQEVIGMEYRPIKTLDVNIKPGTKVLICGPVVCRRGVLLLEEFNVKVLGGECEHLLIQNANENVAARSLGLPETNTPANLAPLNSVRDTESDVLLNGDDEWISSVDLDQIENIENTGHNQHVNLQVTEQRRNISSTNYKNQIDVPDELENQLPSEDDFSEYADLLEENFSEELDTNQQAASTSNTNKNLQSSSTSIECLNKTKPMEVSVTHATNERMASTSSAYKNVNIQASSTNVINSNKMVISNKPPEVRIVDNKPYIYIKQLLTNNVSSGIHVVKAKIISLTKKLSFIKKWSLQCVITDGSGCLTVDFHNRVLEKLIGYTADEMIILQRQMLSNNFYKDQLLQALEKTKDKLTTLDELFEVEFSENSEYATVINIKDV